MVRHRQTVMEQRERKRKLEEMYRLQVRRGRCFPTGTPPVPHFKGGDPSDCPLVEHHHRLAKIRCSLTSDGGGRASAG